MGPPGPAAPTPSAHAPPPTRFTPSALNRALPPDVQLPELPGNYDGSPDYPHGDEQEPEKYAEYARHCWDEQDEMMEGLHSVWVQNLLFLSSRQWWRPRSNGVWAPEPVPEWREQPVSNLCLAYYRTAIAKATKIRPAWQVIPASSDPRDVQAAELADEALEAKWMELRLSRLVPAFGLFGSLYLLFYTLTPSPGASRPATLSSTRTGARTPARSSRS